jgi:hypothetical protein
MEEERPVEAIDEALLVDSCKWFLLAEGEVAGGAERALAGGAVRVLAGGAAREAPVDLVGGSVMALGE